MTDKPEHARAIAAVRLRPQDTEPSPPPKGHLSRIAKALFPNRTPKCQFTKKLENQIENANLILQHRAFLAGKEWNEIKDDVAAQLKIEFTTDFQQTSSSCYFRDRDDTFGAKNPTLVRRTVDNVTQGEPLYQLNHKTGGGRFKAFKNHSEARLLDATQILTSNGHLHELINTPTQEQTREIEQQTGVSINQKGILAERRGTRVPPYPRTSFEDYLWLLEASHPEAPRLKVRFARDLYSGDYVTVKKRYPGRLTRHDYEAKGYKHVGRLGSQERQMQFLGAAVCRIGSSGHAKGYLFTPLMNRGNGEAAAKRIAALRSVSTKQAQAKLLFISKEYAGAVADLHAQNLYHHNIQPSSFLHHEPIHQKSDPATGGAEEIIKIFGFENLANDENLIPRCICPETSDASGLMREKKYSKKKHDAFSLGLTLLFLKHGHHANDTNQDHLCLSDGKSITLRRRELSLGNGNACWGIEDEALSLKRYPLNTLDNIIAHLLNENVKDRISPITAYEALDRLYNDVVSRQSTQA